MTVETHLAELNRKHQALEGEIQSAIAHPATSDSEIATLKRKKLRLKEEIERLRAN